VSGLILPRFALFATLSLMPSTFEGAFAQVQLLAKDFDANKRRFFCSPNGLTDDANVILEGGKKNV
jgi:hypothetical protein